MKLRSRRKFSRPRRTLHKNERGSRHTAPAYTHVNIQPTPMNEKVEIETSQGEDFIRRKSLQSDIEEGSIALDLLNKSPNRPRTFAEATMSTAQAEALTGGAIGDKSFAGFASGHASTEVLGTFKYGFKKKKKSAKWSPLDLTATDTGCEMDGMSDLDSRPVSPNRGPPPTTNNNFKISTAVTPGKQTVIFTNATVVDTDPTPTQARFDFSHINPIDSGLGLEEFSEAFDAELSDSQSTKDRTEAAVAAMFHSFGGEGSVFRTCDEVIGAMEWSASIPPTATQEETKQPSVSKPSPVAYTTVGSLVDPTVVPHFTAPNRIQREGANRRPLMMPIHNRAEPYYRSGNSTFHSQNYSQHQIQTMSPVSSKNSQQPHSARSARSMQWKQQFALTEAETQVLASQGMQLPHALSENTQPSPKTPTQVNRPYMRANAANATNIQASRMSGNRGSDESTSSQGLFQGLEKMQTLQRLAKFSNPMQETARTRLSEFSVSGTRPRSGNSHCPPPAHLPSDDLMREQNKSTHASINTELDNRGDVKPADQSPYEITATSGALLNSISRSHSTLGGHTLVGSRMPPSTYPRPLTAGPPGQRQYLQSRNTHNSAMTESLRDIDFRATAYSSYNDAEPLSPWPKMHQVAPLVTRAQDQPAGALDHGIESRCLDTLPVSEVSKYYPYGYPMDMTGNYLPLSLEVQKRMSHVLDVDRTKLEENQTRKYKELNDWFYSGQKRFWMSAEDHMREAEHRQQLSNSLRPINITQSKHRILPEIAPCNAKEMKEMTTAEAAAPLLDAAFGSLLAYVEKSAASRIYLSKYVVSPAWHIDASATGNSSFFENNYGMTPHIIRRDARYQQLNDGHIGI